MRPVNVVLIHHDAVVARSLADSFRGQFRKLAIVSSLSEAQESIARLRAGFVIVDLELVSFAELRVLCSQYPSTAFAGVHRLPDEAMWSDALSVGAVDCCQASDLRGILLACARHASCAQAEAAVA